LKFSDDQKALKPVLRKLTFCLLATAILTTDRYKRDGSEKKEVIKRSFTTTSSNDDDDECSSRNMS